MMSPSDLSATPVLNAFRTLLSLSSLRDKNKLNFSDQCQTKFLLPKSQNEFYDLLTIPSCTSWSSSTKTKAKGMENMLIFHVTLRIQILTMFSVQSKYSKKTKNILLLGFVISNKTCKNMKRANTMSTITVELTIKVKTKFIPSNAEKTNGFISPQMSNFHISGCLRSCLKRCETSNLPAESTMIVFRAAARKPSARLQDPSSTRHGRCLFCTSSNIFFPSNAFMAFARSLHTFNRSKKMNCKLSCKAVYPSIASKALVMDQYTVQ